MTDTKPTLNRRKFLRGGAATSLGLASTYDIVAEPAGASTDRPSFVQKRRDVAVINNDVQPRNVTLELLDAATADKPLYERRIRLRGLNEPGAAFETRARFLGSLDAQAPSGTYVVRASLPDGESADMEISLGPDGLPDAFGFSVYVHPVDGLLTHAGWA